MSHKDIHRNVFIAVATNLAYLAAGWKMFATTSELLAPAFFVGLQCFASGIHHAVLQEWSQKLDYAGMYGMGFSLTLLGLGVPADINILVSGLLAAGLGYWKASPVIVGIGIAGVFGVLWYHCGLGVVLLEATILGFAYTFNFLGDTDHRKHHSLVHGLPWHIPTAFACLLAGGFLTGTITQIF